MYRFAAVMLIVLSTFLCNALYAQTSSDTLASKPALTAAEVKTEKVEGLWSVMGYLGGKLSRELSNRMNLEGSKEEERKPVRTEIKLGPFKVERVDYK